MTVSVCWMPLGPGGPPSRGSQWDEALLDACLSDTLWRPACGPRYAHHAGLSTACGDGAVVVVPARYWAADPDVLNRELRHFDWCLVVLASDEESSFPWQELSHPNMGVWVMTPRPGVHPPAGTPGGPERYLGEGWPHRTPTDLAWYFRSEMADRRLDWYFAGQVTHTRRKAMLAALEDSMGTKGVLVATDRFAAGVSHKDYLGGLASAKVAPCPSGPVTPDSFRLYEALEAGCLPVADGYCPAYPDGGYWELLCGETPPFPIIDDWADLPGMWDGLLDCWDGKAARASAWWQQHKRTMAYDAAATVERLSGERRRSVDPADLVTVIVTASPVASDPSTALIEDTVASVRAYEELAGCDLIVACDDVRPGEQWRAEAYGQHLRALAGLCEHEWRQTLLVIADGWGHQTGSMRAALDLVRTPLVLVVEHDTPFNGQPVDWTGCCRALLADRLDLVRFHHEAAILEEHRSLMVDETPVDVGVPVMRTVQWSNRPHLATVSYYRRILAEHFVGDRRRAFTEDVMHSVVQCAWNDDGMAGWERHRLALYAPQGSMCRTWHTDGRAGEPKAPSWLP